MWYVNPVLQWCKKVRQRASNCKTETYVMVVKDLGCGELRSTESDKVCGTVKVQGGLSMDAVRQDFISQVDGLKDYYYVRNSGENTLCVVYLHGHGSHGDQILTRPDVAAMYSVLDEKYKLSLIAPNLRDNAWMSRAAVEDLRNILQEAKQKYRFSRYVFLAGSMGATGALIFATLHPELVDGLGLMGAATDIFRYRNFCSCGDLSDVKYALFKAIDENYLPEDYELHNVCANFEKLTMPLVFFHGTEDPIMPVSEMTALQEKMKDFPNAYFRHVPGGHDAPLAYMVEIFERASMLKNYD